MKGNKVGFSFFCFYFQTELSFGVGNYNIIDVRARQDGGLSSYPGLLEGPVRGTLRAGVTSK